MKEKITVITCSPQKTRKLLKGINEMDVVYYNTKDFLHSLNPKQTIKNVLLDIRNSPTHFRQIIKNIFNNDVFCNNFMLLTNGTKKYKNLEFIISDNMKEQEIKDKIGKCCSKGTSLTEKYFSRFFVVKYFINKEEREKHGQGGKEAKIDCY